MKNELIQIKDVLTNKELAIYFNSYGMEFNLVSFILSNKTNQPSQLHNEKERAKIKTEIIQSKNGKMFAYCHQFDLIAQISH
jgi:hypothetical protein